MTREEADKRVMELTEITHKMFMEHYDNPDVFKSEEYKKDSDELDELFDYRKDTWPDFYDERTFALVKDKEEPYYDEIGLLCYFSHNQAELEFPDGSKHWYHAMSLEKVNSSPELRAVWGEIPISQYFKKRKNSM